MIEMLLNEPFDQELSQEDAARAERRRIAIASGAYSGQRTLLAAMEMKTK